MSFKNTTYRFCWNR